MARMGSAKKTPPEDLEEARDEVCAAAMANAGSAAPRPASPGLPPRAALAYLFVPTMTPSSRRRRRRTEVALRG